jgi:hypothetical protein
VVLGDHRQRAVLTPLVNDFVGGIAILPPAATGYQ